MNLRKRNNIKYPPLFFQSGVPNDADKPVVASCSSEQTPNSPRSNNARNDLGTAATGIAYLNASSTGVDGNAAFAALAGSYDPPG
jgi:hypothetical protein